MHSVAHLHGPDCNLAVADTHHAQTLQLRLQLLFHRREHRLLRTSMGLPCYTLGGCLASGRIATTAAAPPGR